MGEALASLLARRPQVAAFFRACEASIAELLPACPERRDLAHGDLLHQSVRVLPDACGKGNLPGSVT